MAKIITESVYEEKTPKKEIDTPIADAFRKAKTYTRPLLSHELLRKRRRVKRTNNS